jgi:hypothetical protein
MSPIAHPGNQPQQGETGWDTGNPLLCERPAKLLLSTVTLPGRGTRLVMTIHTETGSNTIMADKADAVAWWQQIKQHADAMSGSGLVTGNGTALKEEARAK